MGKLSDCLKQHPGLSEIEIQTMIERSAEIAKKEGLTEQQASRKVLEEYRNDIDKDFDSLRKQLKVKTPSTKERADARKAITDKAVQDIEDQYKKDLDAIEAVEQPPQAGKAETKTKPKVPSGKADVKAGERIDPKGIQQVDVKGKPVRPKPIIQIFADLQKNLNNLTKAIGQLKYTKSPIPGRLNIIGAFSPFYKTIAMRTVGDLDTASHELGHAMDEAYGLQKDIPDNIYGEVNKELKPFSKHGSKPPAGHPDPAEYELSEGIAEWIRAYIVNPEEAIANAPVFNKWYQETLSKEAHSAIDVLSTDVRTLVGAKGWEMIYASVEALPDSSLPAVLKEAKRDFLAGFTSHEKNNFDFQVKWSDRLKQKYTDSTHPWRATAEFIAKVGNIDLNTILPSWNPLLLARLHLGVNSKVEDFLMNGFVHWKSTKRVIDSVTKKAKSLEWLLSPYDNTDRTTFDEEQQMMVSLGIAKRTQEIPLKNIEKQISKALDQGKIIPSSILYSNPRFYDKFFERNEALRQELYEKNDVYNDKVKEKAARTESKINNAYATEKAKLESDKRKKQIELDSKRQKYYDQKGEMPEKKRISELRKYDQQATKAKEKFEKAIDKIELERFKAQQQLQGKVDAAMNNVLKTSVMANIKRPKGPSTGIGGNLEGEQALAERTINEIEAENPEKVKRIKEGLRRYRSMAKQGLQYLVDGGRISKASFDAIIDNNEEYIMLQRIMQSKPGEEMQSFNPPGGKALGNVKEPIKSIKGSSDVIKRPYEAMLKFLHTAIIEADRNNVVKSYVDLAKMAAKEAGEDAGRISKIISPAVKEDKNTITMYQNGEAHYYQMDQYIIDSMKGMTGQIHKLPGWATALPALLRASVINNPVFALRNTPRDFQTMLVVSDNVSNLKDLVPHKMQKIGDLKPKEAYNVFGAGQGGYHLLDPDFYNQALEETATKIAGKEGNLLVKAGDFVKLAGGSFKKLSEASEKVTRMFEFKNAFRKAKNLGLDDYNAGLYAAASSRKLMDFAIIGEHISQVNQMIPFLNAKIQGIRVAKKGFMTHPVRFALKAGLTVMMPQFLIRSLLYSEDDEERYLQLPDYQRNMYWNIPTATGWIVIPKPHDIAVLSTVADMIYDKAVGNEVTYSGFNEAIFAILPLSRSDMAGPWKTLVELLANKNFFHDSTIAYDDKLDLSRRNYRMASNLGKYIGETIAVDPRKVDHLIKGTTSYFGNQALRMSDIGREDKKKSWLESSGYFKGEPTYSYKDVQWVTEQAEKHALNREKYYTYLRMMLSQYSELDEGPSKTMMAKSIRKYSGFVKELWESYGIHEEGSGKYQEQFKEATRKKAEKVTGKPFFKNLEKAREKRKEKK